MIKITKNSFYFVSVQLNFNIEIYEFIISVYMYFLLVSDKLQYRFLFVDESYFFP